MWGEEENWGFLLVFDRVTRGKRRKDKMIGKMN